jgi:hypothetical protein
VVSGSTSLSRLHDRSRIRPIRRVCTNIIGFAPRKSTVARRRPDEQGKAAAQSRTQPDAGLRVQRSILLKPSAGQCLQRLPKPGEPQRKFYEPPLVISRQSTAILL